MQQSEQSPASSVSRALDNFMASSLAPEGGESAPVRVAATETVDLARIQRELNVADAQSFYLLMTNVLNGYSVS